MCLLDICLIKAFLRGVHLVRFPCIVMKEVLPPPFHLKDLVNSTVIIKTVMLLKQ